MKIIGFILFSFLLIKGYSQDIVIENINVIDVANKNIQPNKTILISKGLIKRISNYPINVKNAIKINGKGKFLIPGLWDMHTHPNSERDLSLMLIHGITGTRIMAGDTTTLKWKRQINNCELFGPKIYTAGETFESWPEEKYKSLVLSLDGFEVVETRRDAILAVRRQKKTGYDFIKIYNNLRDSIVETIFGEAKKLNLDVCGHVPLQTGLRKSIKLGIKSVEHLRGYINEIVADSAPIKPSVDFRSRTLAWNFIDTSKINEIIDFAVAHGVWNCPTFAFELLLKPQKDVDSYLASPEAAYLLPKAFAYYSERVKIPYVSNFKEEDFNNTVPSLKNRFDFIGKLHKRGGLILAGTDADVYGLSLHRELQNLAACGLSNYEVLKTATINPAIYFGINKSYGTIEEGKVADLVILEQNPIKDITATQLIFAVIQNGHLISKEKINELKEELKINKNIR